MDLTAWQQERLAVVEIFNSISGEGVSAGEIVTFVRLAGCNLRCSYCDTTYSYDEDDKNNQFLTPEEIVEQLKEYATDKIICTGGEPLVENRAKRYLAAYLAKQGFVVRIESNGSCPVYSKAELKEFAGTDLRDNLFYTLDIKLPSSNMAEKDRLADNINCLSSDDELKFVVATDNDLGEALDIINSYKVLLAAKEVTINFSPVFKELEADFLVEWLKEKQEFFYTNNLKVRLSLQLHKLIWDPQAKGV